MNTQISELLDARAGFLDSFEAEVIARLPEPARSITESALERDFADNPILGLLDVHASTALHVVQLGLSNPVAEVDERVTACAQAIVELIAHGQANVAVLPIAAE